MIDPVSGLLALGIFGAGWVIGRIGRLRSSPRPKPVLPICLCEHHYGEHDPETGSCQWAAAEERWSSRSGTHWVDVNCSCVRYTGPQPVEQYWVPPAADMSIVTAPRSIEDVS